jgi:YHS domain-containing protein
MKLRYFAVLITAFALTTGIASAVDSDKKQAATAGVPADYPLKKCPVSDEALGEMGKPVKATHEGTDVYLCCKSCLKDFNKDPAKYTKMVKDAAGKKS